MTARDETLTVPANRKHFLDEVTRGVDHDEAARALGMSGAHTARRYARDHPTFRAAFKRAKKDGLRVRRARGAQPARALGNAEAQAAAKDLAAKAAEIPSQTWLEEVEMVKPEGLKLNAHLPPLSVRSHLAMCQRFAEDKSEHPTIRREAMRQIGMHTLLPALRPPPSRNETGTASEAQQPKLTIPGAGPRVVLVAPDNGMYAPGCGPGATTVIDEAEAADAEFVTAKSG